MAIAMMFVSLLFTLGANFSIAVSLLLSVFVYVFLDGRFPFSLVAERLTAALDSFPFLAIPFYILAAEIMNKTNITTRIYTFLTALVGHLDAGLGHMNVIGSMIFAGMSGSATADVAGPGAIEIKAMLAEGYDPSFTAAITAVSASVGPIIPPSIPFIIYGVLAQVSVGHLFAAGMFPGIVMGLTFMATIKVMAMKGLIKWGRRKRATCREIGRTFIEAFPSLLTPVILLGGMFTGWFTPTEAGAVAVLYALFLGFIYGDITVRDIVGLLTKGALDSARVAFIIAAASVFGWIVTQQKLGHEAFHLIQKSGVEPWVIILLINGALLLAGMFLEGMAILTISVPIFVPMLPSVGMHPVTFGVLLTLAMMIGFLHPPIGVGAYLANAIAGAKLEDMFKMMIPFFIPLLLMLLAISFVPALTLYLPKLLFG